MEKKNQALTKEEFDAIWNESTTQEKLKEEQRLYGIRIQHKLEYFATTIGVLTTYNLILVASLFAIAGVPLVFALFLGILGLLLAVFTRKLVLKTPEELIEAEDRKNERSYTNWEDRKSKY